MTAAPTAAQLIDEFFAGGDVLGEHSFTLDHAASASKMYAFRYTDRSLYLLPLLEAIHTLGATKVTIDLVGPDLLLRAEGVALPAPVENLSALYDHALEPSADPLERALARLGVGLDMALGFDAIERVGVVYSTKRDMFVAEFRPRKSPRFVRHDPETPGELQVLVDRPNTSGIRPDVSQAELRHLRKAVENSKHPVFVEGEAIAQTPRSGTFARSGRIGACTYEAFLIKDEEPSVIELWTGGIRVDTLAPSGRGLLAEIHLDAPARDVSQIKVARDPTVKAALEEHEHVQAELVQLRDARRSENAQSQESPAARRSSGTLWLVIVLGLVALVLGIVVGSR